MPEEKRQQSPDPLLPPWLIALVVITALILLVLLILVGIQRDAIDFGGVATVLSTLISGIVVGVLLKGREK